MGIDNVFIQSVTLPFTIDVKTRPVQYFDLLIPRVAKPTGNYSSSRLINIYKWHSFSQDIEGLGGILSPMNKDPFFDMKKITINVVAVQVFHLYKS